MPPNQVTMQASPMLKDGRMVLAFSGWMDGGDVSSGTIEHLQAELNAEILAEIVPDDYYIFNFPGPMEVSTLFRPYGKIKNGLVEQFAPPSNTFTYDEANQLVLFSGHEPNIKWPQFADCIFEIAAQVGVSMIYFVGSFGGVVPHTREPRLFASLSHERFKEDLEPHGIRFTDYEGPVGLVTYMMTQAQKRGVGMVAIAAEIPAYVQGRNPKGIIAAIRALAAILGLDICLDELRELSGQWEKRLREAIRGRSDLLKHIKKLEEDYDNEVFDTQMGDLKDWLEGQGVRVD